VGIQIGGKQILNDEHQRPDITSTIIKPYSSRMKANVWMGSNGGTGLQVLNGELKFAQAHLTVTGPTKGVGVDILPNYHPNNPGSDRVVWHNQFSEFFDTPTGEDVDPRGFMLVTSGIGTPISPSNVKTDIEHKTF
jgi:hypothetical protein